jgi:xanthine dehydrogenase accessory factor
MFDQFLSKAGEMLASGQSFAIAEVVRYLTPISGKSGDKAIISADGSVWGWIGGGCAQPAVVKEALKALKDGRPRLVRISTSSAPEEGVVAYNMTCHSGGALEVYIEPVLPRPHILILGRSPVGRTLARLAKAINYTVTVAAPEADRASYPDADQIMPDLNVRGLKVGLRTFVVVSTQGEDDEEALEHALQTDASYVAFVASKAKAAKVIKSLSEKGISKARLDQVRAPAGLDIQARTLEEIAVSILAEIIQLGRSLSAQQKETAQASENREKAKDLVCGMTVDVAAAKHNSEFDGRSYYFCCSGCKHAFDKHPEKYAVQNLSV